MIINFIQFFSDFKKDFMKGIDMPDAITTGVDFGDSLANMFRAFGFDDCLQYIESYPGKYENDSLAFTTMREDIPYITCGADEDDLLTVNFANLGKSVTLNISCSGENVGVKWRPWIFKDMSFDATMSHIHDDGLYCVPLVRNVKKCLGLSDMSKRYMWYCEDWKGFRDNGLGDVEWYGL